MSEEGSVLHLPIEDRNTKKVHFKYNGGDVVCESDMVMDRDPPVGVSWRDKVLTKGNVDGEKVSNLVVVEDNEDLEFLEGDVIKSTINGISLINFSDHIQYILVKDMELTVMVKFYHTAQLDFDKVLSWGPWIVYGQYLTVKPWTIDFNPLQPYLSVVLVW
ncbi:hypothetical protein Golob_004135, partial [Gossypium lobatum]|nr:hypothetical protein [Gossypium lobatum]